MHARAKVVLAVFLGIICLSMASASSARASETEEASTTGALPAGSINCADYYASSSVPVYLNSSIVTAASTTSYTLAGYIKNTNPYPIVGGSVYIKVFKQSAGSHRGASGLPVVDGLQVVQNITVPAYGEVPISFVWRPTSDMRVGEYQVVPFFIASHSYSTQDDDTHRSQVDFSAVTTFPLNKGQTALVFSCVHGASGVDISNVRLDLTLSDTKGNLLHSYSYAGDLTSGVRGIGDVFVPQSDYDAVVVDARLYEKDTLVDESSTTYDCKAIDPSLCEDPTPVADAIAYFSDTTNKVSLVLGTLIVLLIGVVWFVHGTHKRSDPIG